MLTMPIYTMQNPRQEYDWGSPTALCELLGIENSSHKPIAEVWMGAHPKAPSLVALPEGGKPLDDLVAGDPERWLGGSVAGRYGGAFPFLLKLLSARKALSIQAHPSKPQAEEGYAREERLGVDISARERNYRDGNHKPEMMVALGDFYGLCGFRPVEEIESNIEAVLEVVELPMAIPLPSREGLEAWFRGWMGLPGATKEAILAGAVARWGGESADPDSPHWWVTELARQYPGDFGALAPLYLNLVHLRPGEALYLGAGVLHAYLEGSGVEIMANSDNVLRAGCTTKHVDLDELLRVLRFESGGTERVKPLRSAGGVELLRTEAEEFELLRVTVEGSTSRLERNRAIAPAAILLATAGAPQIRCDGGEAVTLSPGSSVYLTPGTAVVEVTGEGRLYCATVLGGFGG